MALLLLPSLAAAAVQLALDGSSWGRGECQNSSVAVSAIFLLNRCNGRWTETIFVFVYWIGDLYLVWWIFSNVEVGNVELWVWWNVNPLLWISYGLIW
jgi:hypothetical protein